MQKPRSSRKCARVALRSLALLFLLPLLPSSVVAGDWRVTPIRLELGRDAKSGVVTIVNESEEKLQLQMSAMEWTQDAAGKDAYAETSDLLFFPRMMILEKKEERILRAGIKVPAAGVEKTYRLFIEEIPGPGKAEGANIAIAIRFGVPIFVRPLKEEFRGEAGPAAISAGTLHVPVRNAGNAHFVIQSILVSGSNGRGEEIFSREIAGWYLLAGASRAYTTPVPPEACGTLSKIDIEVRTDHLPLRTQLVADPSMCGK